MKNQNDMIKEVQALLEKGQIEEAIRLMESVPEAERGYELTGLLARDPCVNDLMGKGTLKDSNIFL